MNLKEFQKLPNGTILIYKAGLNYVEVKVSENCTRYLTSSNFSHDDRTWDGICDYRKECEWLKKNLKLAPEWIQKLFEVKQYGRK